MQVEAVLLDSNDHMQLSSNMIASVQMLIVALAAYVCVEGDRAATEVML